MIKSLLFLAVPGLIIAFSIFGEVASCGNVKRDSESAAVIDPQKLATGVWGGPHIRMEVTGNGAVIEFDCANGQIEETIATDGNGSFDVKGVFSREHGGPVRRGEPINAVEVRYMGQASGNQISLKIVDTGKNETIDTFHLTRGAEGRVMKCR